MNEKLFDEEIDKYDEDANLDNKKKSKKKFSLKLFLPAIVGSLCLNFDINILGIILTLVSVCSLTKKY